MGENRGQGILDAADRVAGEFLKNPEIKSTLRTLLNSIDPETAPSLAQTLFWQDMETTFALIAALPVMANAIIKFMDETLVQVTEKIPPHLLSGYLENLLTDIDTVALKRFNANLSTVIEALPPAVQDVFSEKKESDRRSEEKREIINSEASGNKGQNRVATEIIGEPIPRKSAPPASGGIAKELLNTVFLKEILSTYLDNIHPENGRSLAKTFLWEDMSVSFSLLSAFPRIVNWYISALDEVAVQLNEKIPSALLKDYVNELVKEINGDGLTHCFSSYGRLIKKMIEVSPEKILPNLGSAIGSGINTAAVNINNLEQEHPDFFSQLFSSVISKMDKTQIKQSVDHLTSAVLAQKPSFIAVGWYLIKKKFRSFFKKSGFKRIYHSKC